MRSVVKIILVRKIIIGVLMFFTVAVFAQQGINYKALIKDANNAVVANRQVTVQFTILSGATNVYQETQIPTTDANGIIIINIGEGIPDSGVFATIDWGSDDHFLNTQMDTGLGLTDMGTTGFKTVPYALHSKKTESVSGTTNYIAKFDSTSSVGDSQIFDDGTNIGIGTTVPEPSSIVDIFSESKGFLMPRLSTSQRDDITEPATGLMIYNTTLNDGQLNTGTSSIPIWTGIKGAEAPMTYSVSGGNSVVTSSTSDLLIPDMTISPSSGSYIVFFNAMLTSSQGFSSEQGTTEAASLYDELMAYPGGINHGLTFGSGETLTSGVYDVVGAPSIAGILTLDGEGDPNSIFIIRGSGAFTTGVGAVVVLTGGAKAENIFWVSNAAMSTGADTTMKGTMLGGGTGAGAVSLGAGTNLVGRLFTKLGAATLGAGAVLDVPTGLSPFDLGELSTFAMWSSNGAVSDVASATTTGDVGTALGTLTISGTHIGVQYPANTTSGPSTSAYSIYQNGVEIDNSRRTINLQSGIVSLQTTVTLTLGDSIEARWSVNTGEATLEHRTLSLIRSGY
jgi:hypothetical protein